MKKFKIAVVGAATAVGQEVLKTLAERSFPVSEVVALASARARPAVKLALAKTTF